MLQRIKIFMLLAAMIVTAGQASARLREYLGTIAYTQGANDGGTLTFYKDASCSNAININSTTHKSDKLRSSDFTERTVYIKAVPDGIHTFGAADNDGKVTFIQVEKTISMDAVQARRRTSGDNNLGLGDFIAVTAVSGKNGIYCFTMPDDENVNITVTAEFVAKPTNTAAISYIDASGETQSKAAGSVYILDGTETTLGRSGTDPDNNNKSYETWYVCNTAVDTEHPYGLAYDHGLALYGNVHLILADGCKMTVTNSSGNAINSINEIAIHGQSTGNNAGSLIAEGSQYGINATDNITISGGQVTASGTNQSGINSQAGTAISINSCIINATGANYGIYASGNITISGGQVTASGTNQSGINSQAGTAISINSCIINATGANYGIYASGKVIISGEQVEAVATGTSGNGIYTGADIITITDCEVTATGGSNGIRGGGDVTITRGKVEAVATGTNGNGIYTEAQKILITDCEVIVTGGSNGIKGGTDVTINGGKVTANGTSGSGIESGSASGINITGCEVNAEGGNNGIKGGTDVTISGGQVEAKNTGSNGYGIYSGINGITLGWTNATDYICANSYATNYNGPVKTTDGQRFVAYNMASEDDISATAIVSGSSTDATPTFTLDDIAGKTLKPLDGYIVTADGSITLMSAKDADFTITTGAGTEAVTTPYYIYMASTEEAPVSVTLSYNGTGLATLDGLPEGTTLNAVANQPMQRSFAMPAADVALTATAVGDLTVSGTYTYNRSAQTPTIMIDESTTFAATNYTVVFKKGDEVVSEAVNAGTYDVILAGIGQYLGTATLTKAFTIGKADYDGTTTVSANVRSGNTTTEATLTLPALPEGASYASTGTVGGTNDALIDGTPTVSGTTLTYSTTYQDDGASATITIPVTGATNYNDYEVVVTVTAKNKDDAGVSINGDKNIKTVTYGANDFTLVKAVTGEGTGTGVWTWTSTNTDVATIGESSGTITIKKAGSTTIRAVYESDTTMGEAEITLMVNPKALSVTADNFTVSYGDPAPAYTVSYSGFVNDETSSVLSGTLSFACDYTSGSNTGTYTITPSGLTSSNYSITFKEGTLTVEASIVESESGTTVTLDENGYSVTIDEGYSSAGIITLPGGVTSITAASLTYNRTLDAPTESNKDVTIDGQAAKLYTTCLPTTPTTNDNVKYYKLASVSNNTLNFTEEISPAANTPYLMAVTGSNDIPEQVTGSNVTLKKTMTGSSANGYTMMGTHTGLSNANAISAAGGTENDTYILQDHDTWGKVVSGTVYIPAFRAFIVGPATSAGARELNSSFDSETVGIDTLRLTDADGTEQWYDLNGRRIEKPTRKGIYIRNGKMTTTNYTN